MSKSTIMLAKHEWTPKRLSFPVAIYEKLDGVAADFYGTETGYPTVQTRQGEPLHSVDHITEWLTGRLNAFEHLVGELFVEGKDFKDIGGLVRRHEASPELKLYVYDFYVEGREDTTFASRMTHAANVVLKYIESDSPVQIIPGNRADTLEELEAYVQKFFEQYPDKEGVVVRSLDGKDSFYMPGKRSYGMQPRKRVATEDCKVYSLEQAIDKKTGKGNGMVGRINVHYNGEIVGAGPGCLTHKERKEMWENAEKYIGLIAEIAHKPDDSYEALREPRFYRWRPDKSSSEQK